MKWLSVLAAAAMLAGMAACGEDPHVDWYHDDHSLDRPDGLLDPDVNKQDIIPINGDSSSAVDEIMHLASLQPAALHRWAFSAPAKPVAIYAMRDDGDVDVRAITAGGLSPEDFQQRISEPVVLVPLSDKSRPAVDEYVARTAARGSGVHVIHARLHAYCVEAAKQAAPSHTLFVAGGRVVTRRFESVQGLLRVSDRAVVDGILKPQGDPVSYGRFITQYAVWTKLEGWDQGRFTEEFVSRSRAATAARHEPWTDERERTLRALAPGRWRDVQVVLAAAGRLEQEPRTGGQRK